MARTQFTFTFTNAQPGADVGFNFPAFADNSTTVQDGTLVLDSTNSVSVWADAAYLIAHTVDGRGVQILGVATSAYPTQTIDAGVPGPNPFPSGGSLPVGVYLESAQNVTIVDGGGTNVPFDHLYNNDTQRTVLTAIPAGLGLDFVFDGSNATFTCTEDGVWSYQLGCYPNLDETGSMYLGLRGVDSIDFYVPNLAAAFWKPGWVAVNGASSFEAPAGTTFEVFAALLAATTISPYICNSWTAAFQRVR